ncbi:MAG TPA: TonB family protein [Terriglobales bacterium]|nr:TonB family protein [Terriglobales bacterium]
MESNVPGRPIFGEGADQPWPPLSERQKAAGEAGCKRVSVKHFVAPFYPQTARLAQVSGAVTVLARLSREGRVISAIPEGPSALYASALGAVRQWTFHNPDKVRSVTVVINYVLRQESLTTNTPATDVSGDLPCRVEISTVPNLPPDAQPD